MKNIQIVDGAINCAYDIFAATDEQFNLIFPMDTDVAFIDEVLERCKKNGVGKALGKAFSEMWTRKLNKKSVVGIHGMLFYQLDDKKEFYPGRIESEAIYG